MSKCAGLLDEIRIRVNLARSTRLKLEWERRSKSWLGAHLPEKEFIVRAFPEELAIERRAAQTERLGEFPLHGIYGQSGEKRDPNQVRTSRDHGRFYRWLVTNRRPEVVVEFGTAFGVSGMFWLAGLEANGFGELLSFEINEEWRQVAVTNLAAVGNRFSAIAGAFEDKIDAALQGRKIDLAFIDAVHTGAWVMPQFERVMQRLKPGGLIALDDIDFSDDMRNAWKTLACDPRGVATLAVGGRLALFEVAS